MLLLLPFQVTPLDWDAVINSPLPLKVVASSLTTLQAEALSNFTDKQDLVECLRASANVPRIVGPPLEHRGHQLVDAAVFEPIPVKAALRDGCTHVLALCSRAPDEGPAWGKLVKKVVHNAVKYTVLNPVSVCFHQPAVAKVSGIITLACCSGSEILHHSTLALCET